MLQLQVVLEVDTSVSAETFINLYRGCLQRSVEGTDIPRG